MQERVEVDIIGYSTVIRGLASVHAWGAALALLDEAFFGRLEPDVQACSVALAECEQRGFAGREAAVLGVF